MVSWLDFGGGGRSRRPHGEVPGDRRLMSADARSGPVPAGGAYMPPPTVTPPMSGLRASHGSEYGPGGGVGSIGLNPMDDGHLRSTAAEEFIASATQRPGVPLEEDRERLPAGALDLPRSPAEGPDLSVLPLSGPMVLGLEDPFVRSPEGTLSSMAGAAAGPPALSLQGLTATGARLPMAPEASGLPGAMGSGSGGAPSAARLLTPRAFLRGGGGAGDPTTIDARIRAAARALVNSGTAKAEAEAAKAKFWVLVKENADAKAIDDARDQVQAAGVAARDAERAYQAAKKSLPEGDLKRVEKEAARLVRDATLEAQRAAREAHLAEMAEARSERRMLRRIDLLYSLAHGSHAERLKSAGVRLWILEMVQEAREAGQEALRTLSSSRILRTRWSNEPFRPKTEEERRNARERDRWRVALAESSVRDADVAVRKAQERVEKAEADLHKARNGSFDDYAQKKNEVDHRKKDQATAKEELEKTRKAAQDARRALAEAQAGHAGRVRAVRRAERGVSAAKSAVDRARKWAKVAGNLYGDKAAEKAGEDLKKALKRLGDSEADLARTQKELVDGAKAAPSSSPAPPPDDTAVGAKKPDDTAVPPPPPPPPPERKVVEGKEFPCDKKPPTLDCGVGPCPKCEAGYKCEKCSWEKVPAGAAKGKADVGASSSAAVLEAGRPYNPSLEHAAAMPPQTEAGIGTREAKAAVAKPEHFSAKVPAGHPRVKVPPGAAGADLRAVPEAAVSYEASPFGAVPLMASPNISPAFWRVAPNLVPLFAGDAVAVAPGAPAAGGQPPVGPGGGAAARAPIAPGDSLPGGTGAQPKPYVLELNRLHDEIQKKMAQERRAEFSLLLSEMSGDFRQAGVRKALVDLREERYALQAEVRRIERQHGVAFPRKSATDRLLDEALLFASALSLPAEAVGRILTATEGVVAAGVEGLIGIAVWLAGKAGFANPDLGPAILDEALKNLKWARSQSGLFESPDTRTEGLHNIVGAMLKAISILTGQPIGEDQHSWEALAEAFLSQEDPLEIRPGMTETEKERLRWLQFARLFAYLLMALLAKWVKDRGGCPPCPEDGVGPRLGETTAGESKAPKSPEGTAESGGGAEVAPEGSRAANPPKGRGSASAAIEKAKAAGPDQASRAKAWEETAAEYERAGLWERGSTPSPGALGEKVYLGGRADQVVVIGKDGTIWRSAPGTSGESLFSSRVVDGRVVFEVNYGNFVRQ